LGVAAIALGAPRIRHPHQVVLIDFLSTLNKSDYLKYLVPGIPDNAQKPTSAREAEKRKKANLAASNITALRFATRNLSCLGGQIQPATLSKFYAAKFYVAEF